MKNILLAFCLLLIASISFAQTSPDHYLKQLPPLPQNICETSSADKAPFLKLVRNLRDTMDRDIVTRREEMQVYVSAKRVRPPTGAMLAPEPEKKPDVEKRSSVDPQPAGRNVSLQQELKELIDLVETRKSAVLARIKALDQNASAMKEKDIDPFHRQISSLASPVATKEQMDRVNQLALKLKENQSRYCRTYSPQYLALLEEYLSAVKASLPDYERMEAIAAKTQMGIEEPNATISGLFGIEAVRDYLALASKVYKYNLPYEY